MQLNKEKITKNTFFYQNLIVFSWTFVSLFFLKKKNQNHFEIIVTFYFYHYGSYNKKSQLKNIQRNLQIMSY